MIQITLPWPESNGNHQYAIVRNRKILSAKGRAYKRDVSILCSRRCVFLNGAPVSVTLRLFRPRKIGDIDGPIKQILDAMEGCFYENDKQIVELHVYRGDDKDRPRVEVEIKALL